MEAEYMALSAAAREVIYLYNFAEELCKHEVTLITCQLTIQCTIYEDNERAIKLAKLPKLYPRTKHIAIQYHHFRTWTVRGLYDDNARIKVRYILINQQPADVMIKLLPRVQFQYLCKLLCGWCTEDVKKSVRKQ